MSAQSDRSKNTGIKLVAIILGVVIAGLAAFLFLLVIVSGIFGKETEGASESSACTPGDTSSTGVQIPSEYEEYIEDAAAESGFSPQVIGAQIQQESGFDPDAESPAGAQGIAQFMPATWATIGEGGDVFDPEDSIAAMGRYMKDLREFMEDHASDDEHLLELSLAGYNAGQGAVQQHDYDLDRMFQSGGYKEETKPYVENITAAAEGDYTSNCQHSDGGDVPEGDAVETAMHLAWDKKVELEFSAAGSHGKEEAKPEFVETSTEINDDIHTAYFTDCGVFAATVMISSGIDPEFPVRGTGEQLNYFQNSDDYEFFVPESEGELQPGDLLIVPGHIYMYSGERHEGQDGRALGASLYTRPPSGHDLYLSDDRGEYHVARYVGSGS